MAGQPPPAALQGEAYYEFLLGRHLESEGDVDEAIAAYERARVLDPRSAEPPAELAALYARQGRFAEARRLADAALAIDDANGEAHRVLGSVYATLADGDARDAAVTPADAARRAIDHLERGRRGATGDAGIDLPLARLYLNASRPQDAARVLRQLLVDEPDLPEASVLLARAETALGDPERAAAALEQAASGNPRLLSKLAELYEGQHRWADAAAAYARLSAMAPASHDVRIRWATALLQSDDAEAPAQARLALRPVIEAEPVEPRALYLMATAERRARDFAAAEATARALIAAQPDSPSGPFALAQVYEDQRLYAKAADVLEPAVTRFSAEAEPPRELLTLVAHLGFAQLQAGRAEAAITTFERARVLSGGAGGFDTSLIQAYLLARKYEKAADLARAARQRRPTELRLAQLEARALSKAGRNDRAVVVMRDAVAEHADDVQAHLTLAEVLQDAARAEEADQVLDQAAERFPSEIGVPFQRGALLEQRKDYPRAELAFRQALARDPLHAPSLNYLGYMLAERGDRLDEAVSLVERALAIDPDNGSYLDSLGWAYFKQGKTAEARKHLERAADLSKSNSVIQDHLGDVLLALNDGNGAIAAWERALAGDGESIDAAVIKSKIARARGR